MGTSQVVEGGGVTSSSELFRIPVRRLAFLSTDLTRLRTPIRDSLRVVLFFWVVVDDSSVEVVVDMAALGHEEEEILDLLFSVEWSRCESVLLLGIEKSCVVVGRDEKKPIET